jgi:hypothetical protein
MLAPVDTSVQADYFRNFNLCPHCNVQGRDSLLFRMREGMPMISRSDGRSFHLLLADQPSPYPAEIDSKMTKQVSICFWYSHIKGGSVTQTSVVVLSDDVSESSTLFYFSSNN